MSRYSLGNQLRKRKELLYNLGAISSYSSMLIFLWHGIEMLISGEHPKHTLVLYAASSFFSILVMAPYKWDKKWMRIKTSVGIVVFGASLIIYLICVLMNWLWIQFVRLALFKTCIVFLISLLLVGFIFWQRLIFLVVNSSEEACWSKCPLPIGETTEAEFCLDGVGWAQYDMYLLAQGMWNIVYYLTWSLAVFTSLDCSFQGLRSKQFSLLINHFACQLYFR